MSLQPRKRAKSFGQPSTPFDPQTGTFRSLTHGPFREMTIVEVGHDALLCEDRNGLQEVVLKPWLLRKTSFDGETFEVAGGTEIAYDVAYASTDVDKRTATPDGGSAAVERVSPPYAVDEKITIYKRDPDELGVATVAASELTNVTAGEHRLQWEDLNTAGRRWARTNVLIATIASETGGGDYTWTLVSGDGPASGSASEADSATGVAVGTVVALAYDVEAGLWYFVGPATGGDSIGISLKAGVATVVSAGASSDITFQDVQYGDTSMDYGDDKSIEIVTAGTYLVSITATPCAATYEASSGSVQLKKNGALLLEMPTHDPTFAHSWSFSYAGEFHFDANDTIKVSMSVYGSGSLRFNSNSIFQARLTQAD